MVRLEHPTSVMIVAKFMDPRIVELTHSLALHLSNLSCDNQTGLVV